MGVTLTPGYVAAGNSPAGSDGLDNSIWNHWLCKAADWTCSVSEG